MYNAYDGIYSIRAGSFGAPIPPNSIVITDEKYRPVKFWRRIVEI